MRLGPTTATWVPVAPTGAVDRYNTPLEAPGATVDIPGCRLDIEGAEEGDTDERDTVTVRARLFVPYNAGANPVDGHDHFLVDGRRWDVHGDPDLVDSHRGPHHYEVPVRHHEV